MIALSKLLNVRTVKIKLKDRIFQRTLTNIVVGFQVDTDLRLYQKCFKAILQHFLKTVETKKYSPSDVSKFLGK